MPSEPLDLNIVAGFTDAIHGDLRDTRARTHVGEMAQMAPAECLTAVRTERYRSLFRTAAAEVQDAVRGLSMKAVVSSLAYDFFACFTKRYLTYHLSGELANHIGPGQRFESPCELTGFVDRLATNCRHDALAIDRQDSGVG